MKRIAFFILLLCYGSSVKAADYYWVGNGGNWSDLSHWATTSGGTILHTQLPTADDDVYFDANSFSLAGQQVVVDVTDAYSRNLSFAGVLHQPDIACPTTALYRLNIYGSLTLEAGVTISFTGVIFFESTQPGRTITSAGVLLPTISFSGVGGEWTLQDTFNCASLGMVAGTLNTNGQTVNSSSLHSGGIYQPVLNLGSTILNLSAWSAWSSVNSTLTINGGTSVINCTADDAQFRMNFDTAHRIFNEINFLGSGNPGISGYMNVNKLRFVNDGSMNCTGFYSRVDLEKNGFIRQAGRIEDLYFKPGFIYQIGSLYVNGTLHAKGTCDSFLSIRPYGNANTGQIFLNTPLHLEYVDMKGISAIGTGPFTVTKSPLFCCAPLAATTGWVYVPNPESMYWIGGSGNWNDVNHWSYTSGGAPAGCKPMPDTKVYFDANSFNGPGQFVNIDTTAFCAGMDWTGVTNMPTFIMPRQRTIYIFGSLTLSRSMNVDAPGFLRLSALSGSHTLTTHGRILGRIVIDGGPTGAGEWSLQDSLKTNSSISISSGVFNTLDQVVEADHVEIIGFYVPTTLNLGASVINISGRFGWHFLVGNLLRLNAGTSTINFLNDTTSLTHTEFISTSTLTFYDVNFKGVGHGGIGGRLNFHNVNFNGAGGIGAPGIREYNDVVFKKGGDIRTSTKIRNLDFTAGHNYTFQSQSTHNISGRWKLNGTCTDSIFLSTSIPGSSATIRKAADSVHGYYLDVRNLNASGGAAFMAYNSADRGGNTGWNFAPAPMFGDPGLINGPQNVCEGASGLVFHTSPATNVASYVWSVPPGSTIMSGQGDTLIVVDVGTATSGNITVQTSDGCEISDSTSVLLLEVKRRLTPAVTLRLNGGNLVCPNELVRFIADTSGIGSGEVEYRFLINGNVQQSGPSAVFELTIIDGDEVSCEILVTGSECYQQTSATSNSIVMRTDPAAQTVQVNAGNDVAIVAGESIQLNATGDVGTYLWTPATALSSVSILNPIASPLVSTQYTLTVTSPNGCYASDDVFVEVSSNCDLAPMNAFSPNDDGMNDKWIVHSGSCIDYPAVSVYNRYGSLVYQSRLYQNDWNGSYKGKPLPDGTYYAVITYKVNGRMVIKKTDLTILR